MEDNISELEEEIKLLKKRISILEGKENRRKAIGYAKIIIKIVFTVSFIFAIWKGYNYIIKEVPKLIENEVNNLNPIRKNNQ